MEEYSYSRIKRFIDCPLSYMRKYFENAPTESHGVTQCGLFMHTLLEKYERGELKKSELLPYFEKHFDEEITATTVLQMSATFDKDMYSLYYTGFHDYLENFSGLPDCKEIIDVEKEFHFPYNDYSITGKIDLVFYNTKNEFCVLDHKSKNKFKSKHEQAEYARQLYLYAWASKTLYDKYPKWLIFNMLRGKPIYIEFNLDDMYEALNWFDNTVQDIRNTITFDAKPDTFYCMNFCLEGKSDLCEV